MSNICACGMRIPWRHSGKGGQRKVCDSCRDEKAKAKSRNRYAKERLKRQAESRESQS